MRKIQYVRSVNRRDIKIFVGEHELIVKFDTDAIRTFHLNRKKLTPMFQLNIVNDFRKKLQSEAVHLSPQEIKAIETELNDRLDGKIG